MRGLFWVMPAPSLTAWPPVGTCVCEPCWRAFQTKGGGRPPGHHVLIILPKPNSALPAAALSQGEGQVLLEQLYWPRAQL